MTKKKVERVASERLDMMKKKKEEVIIILQTNLSNRAKCKKCKQFITDEFRIPFRRQVITKSL